MKQMKDPNTKLTEEVLAEVLGNSFGAWKKFNDEFLKYDLRLEWRYYKDGGWLAKITRKKNTIIWGSASEGFFSVSFLFSERPHIRAGIQKLDISDELKNSLVSTPKGTFFSIAIDVYEESQLLDIYKLIEYKKSVK
ncbi:MAG: DUF3788 domain-containing protein [Erysipelotrichales bacterium]|nr:DUF3788 domain-containing protein [Erysipelotrichales bacterium]